ncbi:MAG: 2,4-diaminopentanoate dehydrogenase [Acholeplasmataceae bacterium]
MKKIRVIIWGFGAMGQGMADMLLDKKGVEIVGVCDLDPALVGKRIVDVLNRSDVGCDVVVETDSEALLEGREADICLLATDSFVKGAYPKIISVLEHGINCISTAEEMAYPQASEPELAAKMDRIARTNGVTVLGTGINPGFIMDLLVLALSGTMKDVTRIKAKRVNSLSPFGPAVMAEQGVGIDLETFREKKAKNELAGHVGFRESVNMIAAALGVELSGFAQQMEPIVTSVDRKSPYGEAKKGTLAGIHMTAQGKVDGEVMIDMHHPQQIEPLSEGTHTGDYIEIKGTPEINMAITPEIDGGIGTIAICVNMIPHVINAKPGLRTMIDLPVPRAILGDMRDQIDRS